MTQSGRSKKTRRLDQLSRYITRFLVGGAIGTIVFGALFSFDWLVANSANDSFSRTWFLAATAGALIGAGYVLLYWIFGSVPKEQGGRVSDEQNVDSD